MFSFSWTIYEIYLANTISKILFPFFSGGRLWASGGSVQGCTRAHTEDLDICGGQDILFLYVYFSWIWPIDIE